MTTPTTAELLELAALIIDTADGEYAFADWDDGTEGGNALARWRMVMKGDS